MKQQTLEETFSKSNKKNKPKTQNQQINQQTINIQQKPPLKQKSEPIKPSKNKKLPPKPIQKIPESKTKKITKKQVNQPKNATKTLKNQKVQNIIPHKGKAKQNTQIDKKQQVSISVKNRKGKGKGKKDSHISIQHKKEQISLKPIKQNKKSKKKVPEKQHQFEPQQSLRKTEQKQKQVVAEKSVIQDQANQPNEIKIKQSEKDQNSQNKQSQSIEKKEMSKKRGGRWRKKEQEEEKPQVKQGTVNEKQKEMIEQKQSQNIDKLQVNDLEGQIKDEKANFSINFQKKDQYKCGSRRSSKRMKAQKENMEIDRKSEVNEQPQKVQSSQQKDAEMKSQSQQKIDVIQISLGQEEKIENVQEKGKIKLKKGVIAKKRPKRGRKGSKVQKQEILKEQVIDVENKDNLIEIKERQNNDEKIQKPQANKQEDEQEENAVEIQEPIVTKRKIIKKSTPLKKQVQSSGFLSQYLRLSSEALQEEDMFTKRPLIFNKFSNLQQYETLVGEIKDFQQRK